jgi:hypothetical protein
MKPTLPPKHTLKPLISSRTVRAYLLEREEYLLLHPDKPLQLLEAVRIILDAEEGRATA